MLCRTPRKVLAVAVGLATLASSAVVEGSSPAGAAIVVDSGLVDDPSADLNWVDLHSTEITEAIVAERVLGISETGLGFVDSNHVRHISVVGGRNNPVFRRCLAGLSWIAQL